MTDEELAGRWYGGIVREGVNAEGAVCLRYDDLIEDGGSRIVETAVFADIRPKPPAPRQGWSKQLVEGSLVNLRFDDAWWPAVIVELIDGDIFSVRFADHEEAPRPCSLADLRPMWEFDAAEPASERAWTMI